MHSITAQSGNLPSWVQTLPEENIYQVFFVGKSEKAGNYDNFLEAKAGALVDVLLQFPIYKGIEIKHLMNNYEEREVANPDKTATLIVTVPISECLKTREELAIDNTLYQIWSLSKQNVPSPNQLE